jgi:hypothetical protein
VLKKFSILFYVVIVFTFSNCGNTVHQDDKTDNVADLDSLADPDEDIVETPFIFDVKVEKNEKNVLSCRLTFKTKEKIKTVVRYFSKDHKGYEIVDETQKDEHNFFLWGMRAERKYTIEIYDEQNLDEPIETTEYVSGIIPDSVPFSFLAVNEKEKVSKGFVLFSHSATSMDELQPVTMMLDTDGEVVWYFEYNKSGFTVIRDLQYIEKTQTILAALVKSASMTDLPAEEAIEIDLEGNVVWMSPQTANVYADSTSWTHTYKLLEDDTIVFLRPNPEGTLLSEDILNVDRNYNELWRWSYFDHFPVPYCNPSKWCDWTHSNTINMYKNEGLVYLNSRNMSQYFKIDMNSGNIEWAFGKDGDFEVVTEHSYPWIELAHAPSNMVDEDGFKILFYDNGSLERGFSRIVEYRINEIDMTAEIIFEFDGLQTGDWWFSEFFGDVDHLENGNILVTAGQHDLEQESRIFEVTREGEIVWNLFLEKHENWMVSAFNSQKFVPPLKKLN